MDLVREVCQFWPKYYGVVNKTGVSNIAQIEKSSASLRTLEQLKRLAKTNRESRIIMLNLNELASDAKMNEAIENSKKVSKSVIDKNALSNRTVFNSTIYSKAKTAVNATAHIDFALCLLSSIAKEFHQSQVLELLALVDVKRITIAKHVYDKQNVYADFLIVDKQSKIFTVVNQEFFKNVVQMSEFKQQLEKHASKLFALLDSVNFDHDLALAINTHEQAIEMNNAFIAAKTKTAKKKAIA